MIADCIDKKTVQLKTGDELLISNHSLGSLLSVNDSIFELHVTVPSSQDCAIKVCLVDSNGNVNDISYADCGKLIVPA